MLHKFSSAEKQNLYFQMMMFKNVAILFILI